MVNLIKLKKQKKKTNVPQTILLLQTQLDPNHQTESLFYLLNYNPTFAFKKIKGNKIES